MTIYNGAVVKGFRLVLEEFSATMQEVAREQEIQSWSR